MLYKIALFLHVSGALLLCAAMAVEWLYILQLRKAGTVEHARDTIYSYASLGKIGGIAMVLILIPGFYMMAIAWHDASWIIISFGALILIGLIGGLVTGRKRNKIKKVIKNENNISPELRSHLEDSSIWFSMQLRTWSFLRDHFFNDGKAGSDGFHHHHSNIRNNRRHSAKEKIQRLSI